MSDIPKFPEMSGARARHFWLRAGRRARHFWSRAVARPRPTFPEVRHSLRFLRRHLPYELTTRAPQELTAQRGRVLLKGADADLAADGGLDALHRGREAGHGGHARHAPPDRRGPDLVAVEPDRRRGRRDGSEGRVHDQVYLTVQDAGDHGRLPHP